MMDKDQYIMAARLYGAAYLRRMALVVVLGAEMGIAQAASPAKDKAAKPLTGKVVIDGSSTVYPVTEAVAEEFQAVHPRVKLTIGVSGTGGGFKKFFSGDTDINNASRGIKASEEAKGCAAGLAWMELPVAYDGISVVVHPSNTWVDRLSSEQLKQLWEPASKITTWSGLNPQWPQRKIKLYGPGADSGTFDFFTQKVNGKARASRSDYTASEDDSVLVKGVAGDKDALGYFGYAYYLENASKLKVLGIYEQPGTSYKPTLETIASGQYYLARPIFIYVALKRIKANPAAGAFVEFYLKNVSTLVDSVGYVAMSKSAYDRALEKFRQQTPAARCDG